MPRITFHEFRPGRWVKLVDGKIVGPATAAEVTAWKQEKAAPGRIWEDVVKVTKPPIAKPETRAGPSTHKESDQSTIWEDVVKRAKPAVKAEGPAEHRSRKEDTDWAEQAQIWQDVVKRMKKPGRELDSEAQIEAKAKPRHEAPPTRAAGVAKPALKSAPPAHPATEAKAKPRPKAAPAKAGRAVLPSAPRESTGEKASTETPKPAVETPAAKAPPQEEASKAAPTKVPEGKPAQKTLAPAKATAARKAATRPRHPKPSRAQPLAELEVAEEGGAPAAELAEESSAAPVTHSRPAAPRARGTDGGMASPRRTTKAKTHAAQERPNQLYLWIAAAQSDDLLTAVRTGLARYQERFSHPAEVVLCHSGDLQALEGARLPIDVREGKSLAPRNFWIGLK